MDRPVRHLLLILLLTSSEKIDLSTIETPEDPIPRCLYCSKQYLPVDLVYYEEYATQDETVKREIQLKGRSRAKKEKLINAEWKKL